MHLRTGFVIIAVADTYSIYGSYMAFIALHTFYAVCSVFILAISP